MSAVHEPPGATKDLALGLGLAIAALRTPVWLASPRFYPCGPNTGNLACNESRNADRPCENESPMNAAIPERRPATEEISGLIERVTFHNDESGFCVLRVKARGQREETTVVGSLPSVTAGEWLSAEGWWVRDKEHGLQFKATTMKTVPPTTAEGIERYLGSGLVKGIGPILAKKLVGRFGAEVLAVIENRAAELQTVDGIGPKRRERIAHAWQEAKQVREIMLFLHSHGVSTSRAVRIFKTYGEQAIEKVRSNPYMLAKDIYGIGFATADQIAQKVGIPEDSLNRARAGIDHVLLEATSDGHCALPLEKLKLAAVKLLEVPEGTVEQALSQMLTSGSLLLEEIDGEPLIFLPHLRRAEEGIAARIKSLAEAELIYPPIDFEKAVAWCERRTRQNARPQPARGAEDGARATGSWSSPEDRAWARRRW